MSRCYDKWEQIKAPPFVLDWIKECFTIPFDVLPDKFTDPNPKQSTKEESFVEGDLQRLAAKGSLVKCDTEEDIPDCITPVFCVPKKN